MDWSDLMQELAPLRRRWDVAVLASLAGGPRRPADLIQAINAQAPAGRVICWKVLNDALRRLEASGHVGRRQMPGVPKETWYWLCPPGQRLLSALAVLADWYGDHDPPPAGGTGQARDPGPG